MILNSNFFLKKHFIKIVGNSVFEMNITNNFIQVNKIKQVVQTNPIRNTVSFGQTPPDSVELSEKAKFANNLRKNYEPVPIQINFNKAEAKWTMFKNSQMGSQDAFWAESDNGELYYIKYAKNKNKFEHIKSELLATKLYNLAGIQTPEIKPILINNKVWGIASKFETGLKETADPKALHEGFAVDAWLANWDSVVYGNTFEKNGKSIKIDNGGSLNYRAQGELKPNFGDEVDEIITLVDGRNWFSTDIYSSISYQDLIKSFKKVCSISDTAILGLVKDKALAQTLINRKNYMQKFLEKMEENPFTHGKLVNYLKGIKENLETIKGSEILDDSITINSSLKVEQLENLKEIAQKIVNSINN